MTERIKNWLTSNIFPIAVGLMAFGAARLELTLKESASDHKLDVQRVEAQQKSDVESLKARDEALYALQLDILCAVKPRDRRCYPGGK